MLWVRQIASNARGFIATGGRNVIPKRPASVNRTPECIGGTPQATEAQRDNARRNVGSPLDHFEANDDRCETLPVETFFHTERRRAWVPPEHWSRESRRAWFTLDREQAFESGDVDAAVTRVAAESSLKVMAKEEEEGGRCPLSIQLEHALGSLRTPMHEARRWSIEMNTPAFVANARGASENMRSTPGPARRRRMPCIYHRVSSNVLAFDTTTS